MCKGVNLGLFLDLLLEKIPKILGGKAEKQWRCSDTHVSDGDEVVTLERISSQATEESGPDLLKKHHLGALCILKRSQHSQGRD